MPRKASGTAQTKANAKGSIATATTNDGQLLNSTSSPNSGATAATIPARGAGPTPRVKRRRTSNNVNPSSATDMYNSGTIIASNPFDDDHHVPLPNHTISNATNKMMIMSPNQTNHQHPSVPPPMHHHHGVPPMHHGQHHQGQTPHPHHQQMMHPHYQQQHMYPPQHPHAPQIHHNNHHQPNHHYHMQQQQHMSMAPPPPHHISTPPGHMPGAPPMGPAPSHQQHQTNMHSEQYPAPQQHTHTIHNQSGQHMISVGQQHHPNYALPPPQQLQQSQQLPPPQPQTTTNHQQPQTQMIGTSTPPHPMSGPPPSQSPYSTMQQQQQQQGQIMRPHQTMTPPQPQQTSQHPPSHHLDSVHLQQQQQHQPPYNTNPYCGKCQGEIYQNEPNIICKAGCKSFFHISCSGLTQLACDLLIKESLAEWVCDRCTSGARRVPHIKYKT